MAIPRRSLLVKKSLTTLTLTLATLTPFLSASADCDKAVDPARATIFIDTNFGLTEILRAEKAACDRGETFIRLPEEIPGEAEGHADLVAQASAKSAFDSATDQLKRMGCTVPTAAAENAALIAPGSVADAPAEVMIADADTRCTDVQAKYLRASQRYETATTAVDQFIKKVKDANGGDNFVWGMVQKGMIKLAARGIRPAALIISGHSSGSSFGGRFGGIMFNSLQKHILTAYASQPELLTDFHSMYLWGCNTLNPYEPEKWVKIFPTLEMIVGFQGSAPSNLNSSSWTILDGLMHKEREIVGSLPTVKDPEEIRKTLSKIDGISGSVAAVYLHDIPNERGWFYERVQERDPGSKSMRWVSRASELLSAKECEPVRAQIEIDQAYVESIFSGKVRISEETGSGPLREAYTRSRRNDTCRAALGFPYSSDQVGLLLFWHGVKKNAMRFLESDTLNLSSELAKWMNSKATIDSLVALSNADVSSGKASRNGDLDQKRRDAVAKVAAMKARLSSISAATALMPWTKERKTELKDLARRERKLIQAISKGEMVQDALSTVRSDLVRYREAEKIGNASMIGDGQRAVMGPIKTDEAAVNASLSTWEKYLVNLDKAILKAGGAFQVLDANSVYQQLAAFAKSLSPKTVSEISGMSYADVIEKNQARVAALQTLERSITSSPNLMTSMSDLLTQAKAWDERFQKTAVKSETHCMNFLDWHEYTAGAPAGSRPKFDCSAH